MKRLLFFAGVISALVGGALLLASWLSPQDEPAKVDVIVAISGGDTDARARHAISLYQAGWAPRLIFSGAALDPLSPSNAAAMRELATQLGVPASDVIVAEQAANTQENALESRDIITAAGYDSIMLVTSPYHQRRAYLEFRHKLGDQVIISNQPSGDRNWPKRWWLRPTSWYLLTTESLKTGYTVLRNR